MPGLRKYLKKNPFVSEIYHSSLWTTVLLFPQLPEIFTICFPSSSTSITSCPPKFKELLSPLLLRD